MNFPEVVCHYAYLKSILSQKQLSDPLVIVATFDCL